MKTSISAFSSPAATPDAVIATHSKPTIKRILRNVDEMMVDEPPLSAVELSRLLASARAQAQAANAYEGIDSDEEFDIRLEVMEVFSRAIESGRPLRLSPKQVDLCTSFIVASLYRQVAGRAEACIGNAEFCEEMGFRR